MQLEPISLALSKSLLRAAFSAQQAFVPGPRGTLSSPALGWHQGATTVELPREVCSLEAVGAKPSALESVHSAPITF